MSYAQKDARISIVLVALLVGFVIWSLARSPGCSTARCRSTSASAAGSPSRRRTSTCAALARGGFESWPQWGRAFLDGRVLWGGEVRSYYEIVVDKLLKDPKSAWNRVSWQQAAGG